MRKDGRFTFAYVGEIYFMSPSELSERAGKDESTAVFLPEPCLTDDGTERECNAAELDQQQREWQDRQRQAASEKPSGEQMAALMGAKNMDDPQTAQEFAKALERQQGWRRVTYKGKGLFDVDYAISGTLSHDFVFPVMQQFPLANPFVQISLRKDGSVRIDAPGFSSGASAGPLKGLASMAAMDGSKQEQAPQLPVMDGTFTLVTDGRILANNTEEGPSQSDAGSRLVWTVNAQTASAPTVLIGLDR